MELSKHHTQLFFSAQIPRLQNRVYADEATAKDVQPGCLNIVLDNETGFAFNANFQERNVLYDQFYDNSVPSKVFMDYYDETADYLVRNYGLDKRIIVDIGCGKGTFLSRLAKRYDFVQGKGIDPSYDGPLTSCSGRVQFINEYFSPKHISGGNKPAIVLCRHVLEHIPSPMNFLKIIFKPFLHEKHEIPVFIEVPDIYWIIENRAFWDFSYEHVNYFNHESLAQCITQAGGHVSKSTSAFGGQYIWAEAILNPTDKKKARRSCHPPQLKHQKLRKIEVDFKKHLDTVMVRIKELSIVKEIVVWGMASKGVMYTLHLVNSGIRVDNCVDINDQKQGKYIPLSGLKILSPHDLLPDRDYAIICMNPNYVTEIALECRELGLNAILFTPDGDEIHLRKG